MQSKSQLEFLLVYSLEYKNFNDEEKKLLETIRAPDLIINLKQSKCDVFYNILFIENGGNYKS